jgi:hypothetical protein
MSRYSEGNVFPALFMFIGFVLFVGGIACIHWPSALVLGGLVLGAFGFFGRRGAF